MKKSILAILFLSYSIAFCNDGIFQLDSLTGRIKYAGVVEVPALSKDEIYTKIKKHLAKVFNSLPDVMKLDDKENGIIMVKGIISVPSNATAFKNYRFADVTFSLEINIKDGKYRYVLTDVVQDCNSVINYGNLYGCCWNHIESEEMKNKSMGCMKSMYKEFREKLAVMLYDTIIRLKNAVNKPANSEW